MESKIIEKYANDYTSRLYSFKDEILKDMDEYEFITTKIDSWVITHYLHAIINCDDISRKRKLEIFKDIKNKFLFSYDFKFDNVHHSVISESINRHLMNIYNNIDRYFIILKKLIQTVIMVGVTASGK